MHLEITRFTQSVEHGTFSILSVAGEFICFGVEQPWRDNKPFISCIPPGTYDLGWHYGRKHTYAPIFINPALRVFRSATGNPGDRYACLIHVANRAAQLQGCLAPGQWLGNLSGERAVTHSRAAYNALVGAIEQHGIRQAIITERWEKIWQ